MNQGAKQIELPKKEMVDLKMVEAFQNILDALRARPLVPPGTNDKLNRFKREFGPIAMPEQKYRDTSVKMPDVAGRSTAVRIPEFYGRTLSDADKLRQEMREMYKSLSRGERIDGSQMMDAIARMMEFLPKMKSGLESSKMIIKKAD